MANANKMSSAKVPDLHVLSRLQPQTHGAQELPSPHDLRSHAATAPDVNSNTQFRQNYVDQLNKNGNAVHITRKTRFEELDFYMQFNDVAVHFQARGSRRAEHGRKAIAGDMNVGQVHFRRWLRHSHHSFVKLRGGSPWDGGKVIAANINKTGWTSATGTGTDGSSMLWSVRVKGAS